MLWNLHMTLMTAYDTYDTKNEPVSFEKCKNNNLMKSYMKPIPSDMS